MILDEIAASTRLRVEKAKLRVPLEEMKRRARLPNGGTGLAVETGFPVETGSARRAGFPVERELKRPGIHFICEVKKASPSKGLIAGDFPYLKIAEEYEEAGAAVISCLTEPKYFLGSDRYLQEIKGHVKTPVLRKDFTVDEYQIYEAKVLGADMVLLICALLDRDTLMRYIEICDSLGLSALVEAHDEGEMKDALAAGARIIGVNNRNLKDFTVDIHNSIRLRGMAPEEIIFVAESGIRTAEDVRELREAKVNGVLIGEILMRSQNKRQLLEELRGNDED